MQRTATMLATAACVLVCYEAHAGSEFIPDLAEPATLGVSTTFRVELREQAKLEVPTVVTFDVGDTSEPTPQTGTAAVRATGIVLAPDHKLMIQIAPASATFTDQKGHSSYPASKVVWAHGQVSGGEGIPGALGTVGDYRPLMVCNPGGPCESPALRFVLQPDATQTVAGTHTLNCLYRTSSIL